MAWYRGHTLRVQVPNHKVSTQSLNYDSLYGNPKYPMVRYFGPLGIWEYFADLLSQLRIQEAPDN